jgi:4-amino-4-deoxy-L-arabinose transferase-like glycosyltransferase
VVLCLLFLLTLLVRFAFFFPASIDWDEASFVLIGQSLADGHLPYEQAWDVKPPLGFAFYAAVIRLFGHSVAAIRLGGTVCVAATAFFVYLMVSRIWGHAAAWLAASMTILGMSLLASGQATMTEHVMLVPFMAAMVVAIQGGPPTRTWFVVGALFSAASLVRFNAAFAVLPVAAFAWYDARQRSASGWKALAAYCCGAALPVAFAVAAYVAAGEFGSLWTTVVTVPVSYRESQGSAIRTLVGQVRNAYGLAPQSTAVPWLTGYLWGLAALGFGIAWLRLHEANEEHRRSTVLVTLVTLTTALSVMISGRPLEHYLLQLIPLAAVLSGVLLHLSNRRARAAIWGGAALCAVLSSTPIVAEYRGLLSRVSDGGRAAYGPPYEVADYLSAQNPARRPVFLLNDHLVYWLMKQPPPTRFATHPSHFSNSWQLLGAFGTTPGDELRAVFRLRPEFVAIPPKIWFMDCDMERLLRDNLADGYVPDVRIGNIIIYRRSSQAVSGAVQGNHDLEAWTTACNG